MKNRIHSVLIGAMLCICLLLSGCSPSHVIVTKTAVSEQPIGSVTISENKDDQAVLKETEEPEEQALFTAAAEGQEMKKDMLVHVCGAVAVPGVYTLQEGDRVVDAVRAAGGFAAEADQEWCNQAMALCDGDKLRIYTCEETSSFKEQGITPEADLSGVTPANQSAGSDKGETKGQLININTATCEELMTLPGIGETRAKDIISYRNMHGAFSSVEQIMEIGGIKNAVFGRICGLITI